MKSFAGFAKAASKKAAEKRSLQLKIDPKQFELPSNINF